MNILLYILLTIHVAVSVLIVLAVLMQRPRSEGLGAAFGGGMTDNLFGAQTTHVLAKFTTVMGITFFVLTLALAMIYSRTGVGQTQIQRELLQITPPAAVAPDATAPAAGGSVVVDEVMPESEAPVSNSTDAQTTPVAPEVVVPDAADMPAAPAPEPAPAP
ncbi:MAG: preprotein translocase subunit SecG [Chthoniobacterales bacterium]